MFGKNKSWILVVICVICGVTIATDRVTLSKCLGMFQLCFGVINHFVTFPTVSYKSVPITKHLSID